jgi:hypothetical protein
MGIHSLSGPIHNPVQSIKLLLALVSTVDLVRFEVSIVVAMKNVVFWDVTPCGSCKN